MQIKKNIKWVGINQVFKIVVQIVGMVVLARIIAPKEYGVMSMALVVTVFASIFRDLGTSAAIIQKKELDRKTINAVFWLNVFMGLSIGVVIAICSPFIAQLFHEKRLVFILCIISLSFPVTSLSSVHLALLERESKFNKVAFVEMSSSALGLVIAILMALLGYGVYSLVAQTLISSLFSTILLWLGSDWRPMNKVSLNRDECKNILSFSGNLTGFNIINYFSRNADSIIIGHVFSPQILGAYSLAYRIMLFPLQSLTFVATRALFPVISRKQDNIHEVKDIYLKVISVISLLVCPIMSGLAILREPFINFIMGGQWGLTSDLLLWLAPTGYIQAIVSTCGAIFMARNKAKVLFLLGVVSAILQVGAFIVGSQLGIMYIAKFYLIANVANFLICMSVVMSLLNGNLLNILKVIYPSITASVLMSLFIIFVRARNDFIFEYQLITLPALGALFYCMYIIIFHKSTLSFLKNTPGIKTHI
ncbi:lipopolysaccharide biosynthesis protein [Buttiauxella sp. WJP83]|uniref:lipopolysaccharide biosynthesis protein n=1 Tax=Buttiauxella sp. WJP83 TaxID=2986951 RepID=UPI0022DD4B9C|nr:lipopolysaccharide biosynthesis protein [Buttiauxella sp. WJP83]WBM70858.1 lipopolysaccharide biosynthesis protein [Buttiauxella sp. WJP83]